MRRGIMRGCYRIAFSLGAAALALWNDGVLAEDAVQIDATYTADVSTTVTGGMDRKARYLDNLDVTLEADLETLLGWRGATLFLYGLNNLGHAANAGAGTAQGINNIEVEKHGPRLYEAWLQQQLGPASIRFGLYDLNSEFYATEASGLLISPPFGIGSELAATGAHGPSIFPSTALAVRLRGEFGKGGYLQAALINADARTWGDRGGIDSSFHRGALAIVEAGWGENLRLSLGGWSYTKRQDHIYLVDGLGQPEKSRSRGAYTLAQWRARPKTVFFGRGGISDGNTGPFGSSLQLGVLQEEVFAGREESALSFGVHRAWFSHGYRQSVLDGGSVPTKTETGFELTFSDRIAPHISLQPDVQYIVNPGGDQAIKDALVTTLRVTLDF